MKDVFYFSHDFGARNDPKLQNVLVEHGAAGLGVYWCIVEQLYEQGGSLPMSVCKSTAFALHVECTVVESVVKDFDLFKNDGDFFWSDSVMYRTNKRLKIAAQRKRAAAIRWESARQNQEQSKSNADAMQSDASKSKEKINKISSNEDNNGDKSTRRFVKPTIEELKSYISEKGYSVDAEKFFNFYESKGWFVGKNKMKNWRSAVANWEKTEKERTAHRHSMSQTKNANDEW